MIMNLRSLLCCTLTAASVAGCLPPAAALTDVSSWAVASVSAADQAALEPAILVTKPATGDITREEFCGVAVRLYSALSGGSLPSAAQNPFTDTDSTDVAAAYSLGLVSGRSSQIFDPDGLLSRQELCKMLMNILTAAGRTPPAADTSALSAYSDADTVDTWAKDAVSRMIASGIINGVSTHTEDATGEAQAVITLSPAATTTREQALTVGVRFAQAFSTCTDPEAADTSDDTASSSASSDTASSSAQTDSSTASAAASDDTAASSASTATSLASSLPKTKAEKMTYVFGEGGTYFTDEDTAKAAMTEICIPVWRLQSDGSKKSGKAYLTVNTVLAPVYQAVFTEIYNGSEKFPIKDVGSFSWRSNSKSEHRQGTAVDINYESNMECSIDSDGNVTAITCGDSWDPDTDPYAIKEGGDVYNAFIKYGFSWGGNAWKTKRDYMHFSFFGT